MLRVESLFKGNNEKLVENCSTRQQNIAFVFEGYRGILTRIPRPVGHPDES